MITIQRVRVRWTKAGRGAPHADVRRGLNRPVLLPAAPAPGEVLVQDVIADEATGYERRGEVLSGGLKRARDAGLRLTMDGSEVTAEKLPGWVAYPFASGSPRLFRLRPGQTGRWRANFRFIGCACDPSWHYEDWVVHVSNGPVQPGAFLHGSHPDHDRDDRVHLYGGSRRVSRR